MSKIKVAIAEDNRQLVGIVTTFLNKQTDIEVVAIAYDGESLLKELENKNVSPDLIILDIIMPHLDGIGVLEKIRSNNIQSQAKIIMLSGLNQDNIIQYSIGLSADYYLLKPFELTNLLNIIRQLCTKVETSQIGVNPLLSNPAISNNKDKDIELQITKIMHDIGIPANLKGYFYLRDCIKMTYDDFDLSNNITKVLYPTIAEMHETTPSRVERAIRHAIEVTCTRGNITYLFKLLGGNENRKMKPTNSEFIAKIADNLKMETNIN